MKRVPSPLGPKASVAIAKAWCAAKMVNSPAAWLKVIALVPERYCFHGVKGGALIFSGVEVEIHSAR